MRELQVVGRAIPRIEGEAKVPAGRATPPTSCSRACSGASPCAARMPHARIVRIDATPRGALPGVHAVLTGRRPARRAVGRAGCKTCPILPRDRVRFVGEKVAAVAADDPTRPRRRSNLIEVEYEELPAVFDPLAAMQPERAAPAPATAQLRGRCREPCRELPNVHSHRVWSKGDVDAGLRRGRPRLRAHVHARPSQHQGYIEPHACLVAIDADGRVRRLDVATRARSAARAAGATRWTCPRSGSPSTRRTSAATSAARARSMDVPSPTRCSRGARAAP